MSHIPQRTCIICRKKADKSNFIKFVRNKNKEIFIQQDFQLEGRGAYICKNKSCLETCIKNKTLNKIFKMQVSQEFYEGIVKDCGIE